MHIIHARVPKQAYLKAIAGGELRRMCRRGACSGKGRRKERRNGKLHLRVLTLARRLAELPQHVLRGFAIQALCIIRV